VVVLNLVTVYLYAFMAAFRTDKKIDELVQTSWFFEAIFLIDMILSFFKIVQNDHHLDGDTQTFS